MTDDERKALVAELRDNWEMWGSPTREKCINESCMAVDCKEAADEIESLVLRLDLVEKDRARILADWQAVSSRLGSALTFISEMAEAIHLEGSEMREILGDWLVGAVGERWRERGVIADSVSLSGVETPKCPTCGMLMLKVEGGYVAPCHCAGKYTLVLPVEKPFLIGAVSGAAPKDEIHFVQDGKLVGKIVGIATDEENKK